MNQQQRKHALKRVAEIEAARLGEIKKSNFQTDAIRFSPEKRLKLFKAGKYKLNAEEIGKNPFEGGRYAYFRDAFLFDGERLESFDDVGYEKARKKIFDEANQIRDEIMWGDGVKALELIRKYEKTK